MFPPTWKLGLVVLAALLTSPALGVEADTAATLYSRGVHAYFSGRTSDADALLSGAIELEPNDPRMYYFRGMCRLRLGWRDAAYDDLMIGAALEAAHPNQYPVGRALVRVQGSDRLLLEKYRRSAREQAAIDSAQRSARRKREIAARDEGVVRQRIVIPLDELLRTEGPRWLTRQELENRRPIWPPHQTPSESSAPAALDDPFREDVPAASAPPASEPAPVADEPARDAEEADDNPFSDFQ